jgi:hypothetical protein
MSKTPVPVVIIDGHHINCNQITAASIQFAECDGQTRRRIDLVYKNAPSLIKNFFLDDQDHEKFLSIVEKAQLTHVGAEAAVDLNSFAEWKLSYDENDRPCIIFSALLNGSSTFMFFYVGFPSTQERDAAFTSMEKEYTS